MKVRALKFTKSHGFHRNTEMGVFHGRRPISRKMSQDGFIHIAASGWISEWLD